MTTATPIEITRDNFRAEVLESDSPVLVDFWAPWCAPCRAIAPALDTVAEKAAGRARVGKVNVDEHPELASEHGISSIPTMLVFSGGKVVETLVGARDEKSMLDALDAAPAGRAGRGTKGAPNMHEKTETWDDTCVCEPEPRWSELGEEREQG